MAARTYVYNRSDTMRVTVGEQTVCFQPGGVEVEVQEPNGYIDDLEAQGIITRVTGGFSLNIHIGPTDVILNGVSYTKKSVELVPDLGAGNMDFLVNGAPVFQNILPQNTSVDGEAFSNDINDFVALFQSIVAGVDTPSISIVASYGSVLTDARMVGRNVTLVVLEPSSKNTGFTKTLNSDTLTFTDGTEFVGGEKVSVVFA